MTYVDGFVVPIPHDRKDAYFEMSRKSAAGFRKHGALHVVECWGNDLPRGKTTDFFMAVKAEENENVGFSWIVWPSKEARDAGWEAIMADPEMQPPAEMPFDGKRMFWGGFEAVIDTAKD